MNTNHQNIDRNPNASAFRLAGWLWLVGCLAIGALCASKAIRFEKSAVPPSQLALAATASPSTPIYKTKNIEDIRAGDYVLARDQASPDGPLVPRRVVQTFVRQSADIRVLTIHSRDGRVQTIRTTDEHPFWSEGRGWTEGAKLNVGERISQLDGVGEILSSTSEEMPQAMPVFNFEVEDAHTYFVSAKNSTGPPIWSHNKCWDAPVDVAGRRVYQRQDLFDPYATINGKKNLDRMRAGKPPLTSDGRAVNLHHLIQEEPGAIAEVGGAFHQRNTKVLHGLVTNGNSFRYSKTGRKTPAELAFGRWSYAYWKERAKDF